MPDFWLDQKAAEVQMKKIKMLRFWIDSSKEVEQAVGEVEVGFDFVKEGVISEEELDNLYSVAKDKIEKLELRNMLRGEEDKMDAILKINSGAGGTESQDWASMLMRLYLRYAERHGYKTSIAQLLEGDEAGIKSVMFQVNGENAYGYLKSEAGVHRLVRISPFNAQAKRQTSFVSCDVMPDLDKDIDIEVRDEDIRVDTYRSSGAGGQHINKTSSAIRITHLPTGIVVTCQNERSQHMNKDKAMQVLKLKLYMLEQEKQAEKEAGIRGEVTDIAWGHQIRSYVLQPYTMVKDLRTGEERAQASAVLDGDLDPFINAYLKWTALKKKEHAK